MGGVETGNRKKAYGREEIGRGEIIYMTRDMEDFEGTAFKSAVYESEGMTKVMVNTRVPEAIGEQIQNFADTHAITRTEAMCLLMREGFNERCEWEPEKANRWTYTVRIPTGARPEGYDPEEDGMPDWVFQLIHGGEPERGEYSSSTALSVRVPQDLADSIEREAEESGASKTEVSRNALIAGLKADPLPEGNPDPTPDKRNWESTEEYTLGIGPERAELFRRVRLYNCLGPSEAAAELARAYHEGRNVPRGYRGFLSEE